MTTTSYLRSAMAPSPSQNWTIAWGACSDRCLLRACSIHAPVGANISANVTSAAHNELSRTLAAASTVLLRNADGALPLRGGRWGGKIDIAVLGSASSELPVIHGNGSGHVDAPYISTGLDAIREACNDGGGCRNVTHATEVDLDAASAVAAAADVAVVFVATVSGEGAIARISAASGTRCPCPRGRKSEPAHSRSEHPGCCALPRVDEVAAVLLAWMPGQEAGMLPRHFFGRVNPSGRLSVSLPNRENEVGFAPAAYPGLPPCPPANKTCDNGQHANYTEGLEVGYRWYDAHNVAPAFAFGHGLSYTTFAYKCLRASTTAVTVDVQNTGSVDGAEIAQLYLGFPASAGEPPKQLKGFEKVQLKAGETRTVTFPLNDRAVSVWE